MEKSFKKIRMKAEEENNCHQSDITNILSWKMKIST